MAISDSTQDNASQTPSEFRPHGEGANPLRKRGWVWFLVIVVLAAGGFRRPSSWETLRALIGHQRGRKTNRRTILRTLTRPGHVRYWAIPEAGAGSLDTKRSEHFARSSTSAGTGPNESSSPARGLTPMINRSC